ncbi:MAG: flagellar motor switch protein FliM [Betaproteobacteria bacterium]|nr:flagellar motor switch protein FliM [Betaproteobacteria bacterium]
MPDDFLSQDEVDALLKGVTGETDEQAAAPQEEGGIRGYDLGRQERIVRGRMPTLELIHERFARNLRLGLFNYMQRNCEISVHPIKVEKYAEFVRNLVVPTNLNLVQARPLRGTAMIVFDPNLVFLVVDNLFGGDGRFHMRVEGREFTPTEQRIIQGMLKVVFTEMEKAWQPVFTIRFDYIRSEMNCQFANIATPSELVVTAAFTIELGSASAAMHLCIPYAMIEPIRETLYSTMQSDQVSTDNRWVSMLTRELQSAHVELVATLGNGSARLRDLMGLKVGDVLPVNIDEIITAEVDQVPVMQCRYGIQNARYALKLERFIGHADDHLPLPGGSAGAGGAADDQDYGDPELASEAAT